MKTRRQLWPVERGEIKSRKRAYCEAGAENEVSYKNNTITPDISKHCFPKGVVVWPKWKRFDRRYGGDFTLQSRRHYAPSRVRRRLLWTHTTSQIRGRWPMNSAEKNADLGVCSHPGNNCSTLSCLTFCKRSKVYFLLLLISRAWDVLISLVFPRDYICTFLIVWKSCQL